MPICEIEPVDETGPTIPKPQGRYCMKWSQRLAIPRAFCSLGSAFITCVGNQRHVVAVSLQDFFPPDPCNCSVVSIYRSTDDGLTWAYWKGFNGHFQSVSGIGSAFPGHVMIGFDGFGGNKGYLGNDLREGTPVEQVFGPTNRLVAINNPGMQMIGVSVDGGLTFRTAVTENLWEQIVENHNGDYEVTDFIPMDNGEVLAIGRFTQLHESVFTEEDGEVNPGPTMIAHALVSRDGGTSFDEYRLFPELMAYYGSNAGNRFPVSGAYLGDGVVLVGIANGAEVWRSNDYGVTWTRVPLPKGSVPGYFSGQNPRIPAKPQVVRALGVNTGKAIVGGGGLVTNQGFLVNYPRTWRTTDYAQTFTEFSESFGDPWDGSGAIINDEGTTDPSIHAVGTMAPDVVVVGMQLAQGQEMPWRVSIDEGQHYNLRTCEGCRPDVPGMDEFTPLDQATVPCLPRPLLLEPNEPLLEPNSTSMADDGSLLVLAQVDVPFVVQATAAVVWRGEILKDISTEEAIELGLLGLPRPGLEPPHFGRCHISPYEVTRKTCPEVPERIVPFGGCDYELTDEDIISGRWAAGDGLVINRVIFSIDWDWEFQQFTKHVIYTFPDSVAKYGLRPALLIPSKGLHSNRCNEDLPPECFLVTLDERVLSVAERYTDPPPVLILDLFYRNHYIEPADIVCLTSSWIPNLVTGARGIDGEAFEVLTVNTTLAPEGKVTVTLIDVEAVSELQRATFQTVSPEELATTARFIEQGTVDFNRAVTQLALTSSQIAALQGLL